MLWITRKYPQHIVTGQHRPTWKCRIGVFRELTRLARGKAISRQTRQSRHCWALWGTAALGRKRPSLCCEHSRVYPAQQAFAHGAANDRSPPFNTEACFRSRPVCDAPRLAHRFGRQGRVAGTEPRAGCLTSEHGEYPHLTARFFGVVRVGYQIGL
jgi:hypothetical protein